MYWALLGILFAVALLGCCIGFKKFVYFLSIGYGFAMILCSIAIFVMVGVEQNGYGNMLWLLIIQCVLFIAYGARLSGYLILREAKSASYRKLMKQMTTTNGGKKEKKMPFFVLCTIWITVGVLYVTLVCPVLFRHMNGSSDWILPVIGIAISIMGLSIETIADMQKTKQKKANPNFVATKGLYKLSRCPNYFGEIVFWTGIFVSGITAYTGFGQWLLAALGFVCIVYIMVNGGQRLERRQNKNYGAMPEYQAYVSKTPALFPFIPLYHLVKVEKSTENKETKN